MDAQADIGMIGLAVMGQNLVLNMSDKGFTVAVYNRTPEVTDAFMAGPAAGANVIAARSLEELVRVLRRPRRVMLMVRAGSAVDSVLAQLTPLLEEGDIVIDGGNANFHDSRRRAEELAAKGLLFVGAGVSGGEEGARHGPSIMPGGHEEAWPHVKEIFQAIAAKVGGVPCCDWVGEDGSGHFVKMVHNGIEYGDMQLIAEAYHLMRDGLELDNARMHEVFAAWNRGKLDSYLIEITRDILAYQEDEGYTLDVILDSAGQKGTGKWTSVEALEQGVPLTLITEAVLARFLSALKDERVRAASILSGPSSRIEGEAEAFLRDLEQALYAAKIVSYAQGYMLFRAAANAYNWHLNYGGIALMWRGGCIIRSRFLDDIAAAFEREPGLENVLLDPFFKGELDATQSAWRRVVAQAALAGIPVPALSAALAFYDGYRSERLPANLIQAQRDYFGAHTYERLDAPRGEFFHTNWSGRGGGVSAESYNA
jgi:6-phosphogluconate dehydrogenase